MYTTMYHGTTLNVFLKIRAEGIKPSTDGIVYLCKEPKDCAKFMLVRGIQDFVCVKVCVNEREIEETFDHNYFFFRCRCYGFKGTIPADRIRGAEIYHIGEQ